MYARDFMRNACHVFELNFEVYNVAGPHISWQRCPRRQLIGWVATCWQLRRLQNVYFIQGCALYYQIFFYSKIRVALVGNSVVG